MDVSQIIVIGKKKISLFRDRKNQPTSNCGTTTDDEKENETESNVSALNKSEVEN